MTQAPTIDFDALTAGAKETAPITTTRGSKFANNKFIPLVKGSVGKTLELPPVASAEAAKEVQAFLRNAADQLNLGLSTTVAPRGKGLVVTFSPKPKRANGGLAECPVCSDMVTVTTDGRIRVHGPRDARCEGSGAEAASE